MKKVEYYEAFDGTRFDNERECKQYEEADGTVGKAIKAVNYLRDFCLNVENCSNCPFLTVANCAIKRPLQDWDEDCIHIKEV